jgi:hypothetical protein
MAGGFAAMRRRLDKLEACVPAPAPASTTSSEEVRRLKRLDARLDRLLRAAVELMSAEEREQVRRGMDEWNADGGGPYPEWFWYLCEGQSDLPEMTPEAMKAVLLAWLSPERDWLGRVCRQCGLEYPTHKYPPMSQWKLLPGKVPWEGPPPWYDLPDFFTACPGCGAARNDIDWPNQVPDDAPWKLRAKAGPQP